VVRPFRAETVRRRELAVEAPQVRGTRKVCHLVHDDLRLGAPHGLDNRGPVEAIGHDRLRAGFEQRTPVPLRARHAHDLEAARDEERHEPPADCAGRTRHEDSHSAASCCSLPGKPRVHGKRDGRPEGRRSHRQNRLAR